MVHVRTAGHDDCVALRRTIRQHNRDDRSRVFADTTMLELSPAQRVLLAETLRDIANVAAGAMVFGQFLTERPFSPSLGVLGMAVWICLVVSAIAVAGRRGP